MATCQLMLLPRFGIALPLGVAYRLRCGEGLPAMHPYARMLSPPFGLWREVKKEEQRSLTNVWTTLRGTRDGVFGTNRKRVTKSRALVCASERASPSVGRSVPAQNIHVECSAAAIIKP
uniref:Putative secreted protein n=1 Tax=Anopheles darlingi TaxID=43151 RepID=A0A2M4DQ62_ANODA